MTIRKVLRAGHPELRRRSRDLDEDRIGSDPFEALLDDMFDTMYEEDGVGLAAPQVQENLRLVIYEIGENPRYEELEADSGPTVLVNPRIVERSEQREEDWEGCLSLPRLRGRVPRHRWVKVRAHDRGGENIERRVEGFEARVIQHEIDHLDGRLFVDRMDSMASLCFLREYRRYHAEPEEERASSGEDDRPSESR